MVFSNSSLYRTLLLDIPDLPYETGGILGGAGGVVFRYSLDLGIPQGHACCYSPDTALLNQTIRNWLEEGFVFMGIFHTHHFGVKTLSPGDKEYIARIMSLLPSGMDQAYFPIVSMPEREMTVYKATRQDHRLSLSEDHILFQGG